MILFDPGMEGGGGGGGAGGGAAVAEAPAGGSNAESNSVAGAGEQTESPAEGSEGANSEGGKGAQEKAQAVTTFRPSILQWAKDRGYSDEEIKEFSTERALLRALGNLPEPAQAAPAVKQAEVPKAQPAPVKEAQQVDEIDVSKIPDLQDGPDGYDGPIVAAFNGMKKVIMQMQQRDKDRERQSFEAQMFPMYEAADEYFDSQTEFADVFGKGVQAAGTPTQAERVKVFEMAEKLAKVENKPLTAKNIKVMLERAQILVHKDRVFAAKKAEGKQEVTKAVTQRKTQFIARPNTVRTVPGESTQQAPAGSSAYEKFAKRAEAAGIKN